MLGSKQKTLHKSSLKFDPGRGFPDGSSETLISVDLGMAKALPETGGKSTLAVLPPLAIVRALTNSGGEAPNDLPFAFSLDAAADWILEYEEGEEKLDLFEYLRIYWERALERDDGESYDPDSTVLPYLLAGGLVNRSKHNGGGSEGTFTALLQQNKVGGVVWGQIKYNPINLFIMQLGALALLNEVFLTQDFESVAVPAAAAIRGVSALYLARDVEDLRSENMDTFIEILGNYQSLALSIATSADPRSELADLIGDESPESSPITEALELAEALAGAEIASQAEAARIGILQRFDNTETKFLGERFLNLILEGTLVETVGLMGSIANEDLEEEDETTPSRLAASVAISDRLSGPRASGDFTRVAIGLLMAIYVQDARTDEETDDEIAGQISDVYRCADLSSRERHAVNQALDSWSDANHRERIDKWVARREREDTELAPVSDAERSWVEKTFELLVCEALDLPELSSPDDELLEWWAEALMICILRRDQLVLEQDEMLSADA